MGTQDLDLGSSWAGDLFLAKKGARKNMILWRKLFPMGVEGVLCEGIGLYEAQQAFEQAHFSPNPL